MASKLASSTLMFMPAIVLLVISTMGLGWLAFSPRNGEDRLLVLFSPISDPNDRMMSVIRSGGRIMGQGDVPYSLIVQSLRPDYATALYREGAWLVLTGSGYGGCFQVSDLNNKRGR